MLLDIIIRDDEIEFGDIVEFRQEACLLVEQLKRLSASNATGPIEPAYTCLLISIKSGRIFGTLHDLEEVYKECRLVLKGKDAVITRRQVK